MAEPWESPTGHFDREEPLQARYTYPLATFGQRALAWVVDIVLLAAIGEVLVHINPKEANGVSALIDLGYMVLLLGGPFGQTVGAKVARVRVVNMNGKPLGYLRATARYFVSGISALVFGLGYLWALKDPKKQTFHDKVCGSLVISLAQQPETEPQNHRDYPFNS